MLPFSVALVLAAALVAPCFAQSSNMPQQVQPLNTSQSDNTGLSDDGPLPNGVDLNSTRPYNDTSGLPPIPASIKAAMAGNLNVTIEKTIKFNGTNMTFVALSSEDVGVMKVDNSTG